LETFWISAILIRDAQLVFQPLSLMIGYVNSRVNSSYYWPRNAPAVLMVLDNRRGHRHYSKGQFQRYRNFFLLKSLMNYLKISTLCLNQANIYFLFCRTKQSPRKSIKHVQLFLIWLSQESDCYQFVPNTLHRSWYMVTSHKICTNGWNYLLKWIISNEYKFVS
jgi:hypothetical protein